MTTPPVPGFGELMRARPFESYYGDMPCWCLVSKDDEGHDITPAVEIEKLYAVRLAACYNAMIGLNPAKLGALLVACRVLSGVVEKGEFTNNQVWDVIKAFDALDDSAHAETIVSNELNNQQKDKETC
jgi:hypothetical protein